MTNHMTILIIDDSPEDREVYKHLLGRASLPGKLDIVEAATADDGLSQLRSIRPDCVLLDYRLPDGDGLYFLDRAAALTGDAMLQVVMLTGQGNETVAVEAMKRGAADYLTKDGLNADSLRRAVMNAVERRALHQRLQRAEAEHREFAHTAAHDLKAPLRQIAQYGELLQKKHAAALPSEASRFVDRIVSTSGRMTQMVTDLLSYASVTTEGNVVTDVSLEGLAEDVLTMLDTEIKDVGAILTVDAHVTVNGHRELLARLLQNLVTNALKFRRGDPPTIAIEARRIDDEVILSVADNGIGIEEEESKSIFKPFRRLHSRRTYEGSGIGLATCQRVAAVHEGRIWVESKIGMGTTFFVALPAGPAPEEDLRPHILVVDDDPDDLEITRATLDEEFRISTVPSADAALMFLEENQVALVLSDYQMPRQTGTWLLERVKSRHPKVKRVLTSNTQPSELAVHLAIGTVERFLPKITKPAQLLSTLRRVAPSCRSRAPTPAT